MVDDGDDPSETVVYIVHVVPPWVYMLPNFPLQIASTLVAYIFIYLNIATKLP